MDPDSKPSPAPAGFRKDKEAHAASVTNVVVADAAWRRLVPHADAIVRRAAAATGGAVTVVLDSDRAVRRLNARHRGIDRPTNVLTFDGGDVILALGTVRREAMAERKRPAHHLAHLIVHAGLHLQGHDHHHPGDARRMEMAEARLLARLRVPNPWRNRS